MITPRLRHGFTLIELVVATGVGMFVIVTAYAAVRSASRTIQAAERLALENRLLRAGFVYALDEIDYWTLFDDPVSANPQPLRATDAVTISRSSEQKTNNVVTALSSTYTTSTYGLPFTPFKDLPPVDYDAATTGVRLRPGDPILATSAEQSDTGLGGSLLTRDLDRGWDMHRPYQASDPLSWCSARLMYASSSIPNDGKMKSDDLQLFGRSGLFSHLKRRPTLGYGLMTSNPKALLDDRVITGAFGQSDANEARTLTRYDNRIDYLWNVLGNLGAIDYLPANTFFGYNLSDSLIRGGVTYACEEARDGRYQDRFSNGPGRTLSTGRQGSTQAIVPASPFSGADTVGFAADGGLGDGDDGKKSGSELSLPLLIRSQRKNWVSETAHIFHYGDTYNRLIQIPPLTPQRPDNWPDLRMAFMRTMTRGRISAVAFVRWLDPVSNKEVELEVSALGSTLRGARQQRHRDGGWATFYGVHYDAVTGVLWDNPRMAGDPGYTTSENNQPTLDYPADAADVPARR